MSKINIYKSGIDIKSNNLIDIDILLGNIRDGFWQDKVLKVRTAKTKEEKNKLKVKMPSVTISGTFSTRKDDGLINHSGFICIDIDHVDPNETKSIVCADEHVYAAFTSVSGNGLAVLFKINGKKHKEAFYGISRYLLEQYNIVVDPTAVNVSRIRFVSWDPDIYINENARQFTKYALKKEIARPKQKKIVFVKNDFENIIKQLQQQQIDITYNYMDWLRIGFGIADEYGESGREYFHQISSISTKYDSNICDRQYTACLKANGSGRHATIGTLYYLAKQEGIQTYSKETREIITIASSQMRNSGMKQPDIILNLKEHSDFDHDLIEDVVSQVDKSTIIEDLSTVELIQNEISINWNIRRNIISKYFEIEKNGEWMNMEDKHFNSIFLQLKKHFEKLDFQLVKRLIMSEFTPDYNPLMDFINRNKHLSPEGNIKKLSDCISSEFGLTGEHREYFIRKWLVGLISAIHGQHSPLMLVLAGKIQNTGKTEFFRRLLPKSLRKYYAESKFDKGKDDEILMCQKLIIMDDEMGGATKKKIEKLKELTSRQNFYLRAPYGSNNEDMLRIAVLCGTTNNEDLLNDPTGNRRIIPVNVTEINHDLYNSIDKRDLLIEAYHLWQEGFQWEMKKEDIDLLAQYTDEFKAVSVEEEMIFLHFRIPNPNEEGVSIFLTTEIKDYIESRSRQILNIKDIGMVMSKYKVKKKKSKPDQYGKRKWGYPLIKLDHRFDENFGIEEDQKQWTEKKYNSENSKNISTQPLEFEEFEKHDFDIDRPF